MIWFNLTVSDNTIQIPILILGRGALSNSGLFSIALNVVAEARHHHGMEFAFCMTLRFLDIGQQIEIWELYIFVIVSKLALHTRIFGATYG